MNKNTIEKIKQDHQISGTSFRSLAFKYGLSYGRVYRMINEDKEKSRPAPIQEGLPGKEKSNSASNLEDLPDDVALLKELLRKERLRTELLNNIIDIADKELGANIRKKSGVRRSE